MKFIALLLLSSLNARAGGITLHVPEAPVFYQCSVIVVASDLPQAAEFSFVSSTTGAHGGEAQDFKQGAHEVSVQVDGQWLNLDWSRGGKLVASGQFVVGPVDKPAFKVGILFDPNSPGDQAAVSCQKATK
jgi:hypothetical protein